MVCEVVCVVVGEVVTDVDVVGEVVGVVVGDDVLEVVLVGEDLVLGAEERVVVLEGRDLHARELELRGRRGAFRVRRLLAEPHLLDGLGVLLLGQLRERLAAYRVGV